MNLEHPSDSKATLLRERHAGSRGQVAWGLLRSMRPSEWIKNTMVFAAIVFSGKFFVSTALQHSLEAFAAFCLAASGTYLANDVRDREIDQRHPRKRLRPIATGLVPPRLALGVATMAFAAGLGIAFRVNRDTGFALAGYVVITTLYSLVLKQIVIVDVLALASCYVLRVIAGAEAVEVEFSSWLVLCTFLLALFLGFAKRRDELVLLEENAQTHRPILSEYSPHFLDMMIGIVTASTVMAYVLYTMDPETVARFRSRNVIYTTVFILYGIFRYLYLSYQKSAGGNPAQTLYNDRPLLVAILLWIASVLLLRYLP